MVKKFMFIIFGSITLFFLGAALMYPINIWVGDNFFGGEDHTGQIFRFNVYILWPIFIIFGGFLGHKAHKKYLTTRPEVDSN